MKQAKPSEVSTSGEDETVVARSTMSAEEFLSLLEQSKVSISPPGPVRSSDADESSAGSICGQDGNDKSCS